MATIFRCLTHAPKLPQLDWWPIIRRYKEVKKVKKIRKTIKYFVNDKQNQEDAVEVYRSAAKRKVQNSSTDVKPPPIKKQHNMKVDGDVSHFQLVCKF
ncbi:hypothetical protein Tco_0682850 [Tanacetum coccineum]|uniref:Uncharacterized protein n=1 Tax=Tanacetum coccineum TaxID=301880 RepID=A0ABQ4XTE9_9ASTR